MKEKLDSQRGANEVRFTGCENIDETSSIQQEKAGVAILVTCVSSKGLYRAPPSAVEIPGESLFVYKLFAGSECSNTSDLYSRRLRIASEPPLGNHRKIFSLIG